MKRKRTAKSGEKRKYKSEIVFLSVLLTAIVLLAVLLCLRTSIDISEKITESCSAKITRVLAKVGSAFSTSVFEAFIVFCICLCVVLLAIIITLLVKKRYRLCFKFFCLISTICFLFGSFYMLSAGFAYNRKPIDSFFDGDKSYGEFYEIVKYFKEDYDYLAKKMNRDENGLSVCPYDYDELNEVLKKECLRLSDDYSVDSVYTVKPLKLFSQFFADNGISGITFVPVGDCGVNKNQPSVGITSTALHEMMHSLGIMRENEANAMSCYLLIGSNDEYLRYCGYFAYYGYLLNALALNYDKDEYSAVTVCEEVVVERRAVNEYWSSQSSFFDKVGDFFNDLYLKMSGQSQGSGSYREDTGSGGVEKIEGERVFVTVDYNSFQRAFIKTYSDKNAE